MKYKYYTFLFVLLIAVMTATYAQPVALTPEAATVQDRKITVREAALLGIVEGITEYLPISSTGHLILANHALGMTHFSEKRGPLGSIMEKNEALDSFDIVIQLGAILAVLGLYRKRVVQMLTGLSFPWYMPWRRAAC